MKKDRLKCPLCTDTFGQEVGFVRHLEEAHALTDVESLYVTTVLDDVRPTCACGCGTNTKWNGWKKGYQSKYVRGHNAFVDTVFANKERMKGFVAKRVEGYASGRIVAWNDGLTKETDERIRKSSEKIAATLNEGYASGRLVDWRTLDPAKALEAATKISNTKKALFAAGELVPWNKGLNKHDSAAMMKIAQAISHTMSTCSTSCARRFTSQQVTEIVGRFGASFELLTDPEEYRNKYQRLLFRCKTCGEICDKTIMMLVNTPMCFNCYPKESYGQLELFQYVKSLVSDAVLSDRTAIKPLELDVFVPSKMFGIEYDGLYWHSELFLPEGHHDKKIAACEEAGVSLLRVFEDEWKNKRSIVEAMISHRLGLDKRVVGARECSVAELSKEERKSFFNSTHIDGDATSDVAYGLRTGAGELVAALSLRRPFHKSNQDVLEVARFSVVTGCSVPGALSKLTKRAVVYAIDEGYDGLMTYVDKRIGRANGYASAGYVKTRETKPRFWWTDFSSRINRFSIRADSANGITQEQAAEERKVVKVWGCSNVVMELRVPASA